MFLAKKIHVCKVCSGSHKRHNEQGATQCYQAFLVFLDSTQLHQLILVFVMSLLVFSFCFVFLGATRLTRATTHRRNKMEQKSGTHETTVSNKAARITFKRQLVFAFFCLRWFMPCKAQGSSLGGFQASSCSKKFQRKKCQVYCQAQGTRLTSCAMPYRSTKMPFGVTLEGGVFRMEEGFIDGWGLSPWGASHPQCHMALRRCQIIWGFNTQRSEEYERRELVGDNSRTFAFMQLFAKITLPAALTSKRQQTYAKLNDLASNLEVINLILAKITLSFDFHISRAPWSFYSVKMSGRKRGKCCIVLREFSDILIILIFWFAVLNDFKMTWFKKCLILFGHKKEKNSLLMCFSVDFTQKWR